MTVALYARVSSQRQTNTQTIDQQLDRLRARAEACGARPSAECLVFRDDGYSGTTLRRPGLDALRDAVASRRGGARPHHRPRSPGAQVCAPSPPARGVGALRLCRRVPRPSHVSRPARPVAAPNPRGGGRIRADPHCRADAAGTAGQAAHGHAVALDPRALWLPRRPDRPRDPSGVQVDPAEGAVIQEIFARYLADGATLGTRGRRAEAAGDPHPPWADDTGAGRACGGCCAIRSIWGRSTPTEPTPARHASAIRLCSLVGRQGTTLELAARETWVLVATIPPLISQELFDQAQAKLAQNQQRARRHLLTGEYLLRALVSCGVCGYACKGRQKPPRYAYYLCAGKVPGRPEHPEGRCPARYIPAQALDELVWRDLCEVLTHPDSIAQALERAQAGAWLPQELQARRAQLQQGIAASYSPERAAGRCLSSGSHAAGGISPAPAGAGRTSPRPRTATAATGGARGPTPGRHAGHGVH